MVTNFFWSFLKKYKYRILVSFVVFTLIIDMLRMFGKSFVLNVVIDGVNGTGVTYLNGLCYMLLYIAFVSSYPIGEALRRKFDFSFKFGLREELRNYLFHSLLFQSNDFFNTNFIGHINSMVKDFVDSIIPLFEKIFFIASASIVFAVTLIIFSFYDILLSSLILTWFILYFLFYIRVCTTFKKQLKTVIGTESECLGKMSDCFANIVNIKIFSREEDEESFFRDETEKILKNCRHLIETEEKMGIVDLINMVVFSSIVLFRSCILYYNNKITIGNLVFNITFTNTLFWWMDYVVKGCVSGMADLVKINETINMVTNSNKIVDYPNSKSHSFANGDILFKDVSFKYDDNSGYVFRNFNLHIKHGEKVGLVGHSGVGKTTLISLLLRFYDINDGVISIDGKNIKTDITQKSLRGNIAYVPQDPVLFHRSIRDNIVYGNLNATEDEIIEACKKAYCLDFIQSMEYGFNTIVGEKGAKLSGGQKQRIIIARTILKNSKILILDEATSAIDNNTEKEIQKAMDNLMENRTVIIITHRSQVLNSVDRIVTLDNKKVIKDEKNNF